MGRSPRYALFAAAMLAATGCTGSDSGQVDASAVCPLAVDVSASVRAEVAAADAGDWDGAQASANQVRTGLDRIAELTGRDDARNLSVAYGRHEPGADDITGPAADAGDTLADWVAQTCDRPLLWSPAALAAPTTTTVAPATTRPAPGRPTSSTLPAATTTTVPVEYVLANPEAVVYALLELWRHDRLDETGPLAAPHVVDYLRDEPRDDRDFEVTDCFDIIEGSTVGCDGTFGIALFTAELSIDEVGYRLEQGPRWVLVDFYFLGH